LGAALGVFSFSCPHVPHAKLLVSSRRRPAYPASQVPNHPGMRAALTIHVHDKRTYQQASRCSRSLLAFRLTRYILAVLTEANTIISAMCTPGNVVSDIRPTFLGGLFTKNCWTDIAHHVPGSSGSKGGGPRCWYRKQQTH